MRIYNKKRFILGVAFSILSLMSIHLLILSVINNTGILSIVKNIVLSLILIGVSFETLKKGTNKELYKKANIEEFDERNILIKQKSGEIMSCALIYIFIILDTIFILLWYKTNTESYAVCVLIFTLLIFIYFILSLSINIYYDKKL